MSTNRFYIADTHFGHAAMLGFKNDDGSPVRSFASVEEMDGHMITRWNDTVKEGDTVYHLGDVSMHKRFLPLVRGLRGRKILILGNHDREKLSEYQKYFSDIRAMDRKEGIICSHIPLHPGSLSRWGVNIHGHTHGRSVTTTEGLLDTRYFNVSVEQIDYTPIEYSVMMGRIKSRQEATNASN